MATATSLLSRQARVVVSPTPTTLSETSAILRALQAFGPVSHFFNPRYVPALKKAQSQSPTCAAASAFHIEFKDREGLDKAQAASPVTVEVGHDAIDPEEADPFNVRGFWDRKKVERKTFSCAVHRDSTTTTTTTNTRPDSTSTWNRRILEGNPYHGPFRVDKLAISFQDLMRQGAPSPEFTNCSHKRPVSEADRAWFEQESRRLSFYRTADNGEVTGGLMDTWSQNPRSKAPIGQLEAERRNLGS